ncbi:hypothetical protein LB505_007237 [Fusarium chuoi]|nr:hypothetical protein LB505_007237 [Fusarium chuoi]
MIPGQLSLLYAGHSRFAGDPADDGQFILIPFTVFTLLGDIYPSSSLRLWSRSSQDIDSFLLSTYFLRQFAQNVGLDNPCLQRLIDCHHYCSEPHARAVCHISSRQQLR